MAEYVIRFRNLSSDAPETPQRERIDAPTQQAAIAALKERLPGQELRIEKVVNETPTPKKRKTRAEWIILALVVVLGGVNLLSRALR